ncbi:MAG: carbohydrate ABC transporter permease [Acholeplasmatales bacterium]|jgi:multiple sugar transport system permease protein|nr:carbohydrate ABC transporter permease [Acholeplasmatales bacterium]
MTNYNENISNNKKQKIYKTLNVSGRVIIYIILIVLAFTMVFPYLWMIFTSFKTGIEAMDTTTLKLFPNVWMFENYKKVFETVPFTKGVLKTMIIEISVIPIGTLVSALAAFAFAKLKMPFKNGFLLILLSGTMIPYAALMLPQFRVFQQLNMLNTLWPLILPGLFGNVMMMFFFVQYLKSMPSELIDAAKMDGANYIQIFFKIMFPLILPAMAVQIVFWFTGIWNDFFGPSIYLTQFASQTLQPMLAKLSSDNSGGVVGLPLVMCGSVISSLPILVLYIFFQKYFVESVAITGLKG